MKHSENNLKPRVIIIAGPTCVGKTSIAIQLAQRYGGEIIGADAMQIYRYMNIGTAKPSLEEQTQAKHHMIDIIDPDETFDVAKYTRMASAMIEQLYRQSIPIFLVGGSGLYIKTLTQGLFQQATGDPLIRQKFKKMAAEHGNAYLYNLLKKNDPDAATSIHPNDTVRMIRALEVFEITGISIKRYHQEHQFADQPYHLYKIMLTEQREILYKRINQRVDTMIQNGFLKEVESLIEKGFHCQLNAMQSIGYKHLCAYLDGRYCWEEAIQLMKRDTRRYAKRQFTWFRSDKKYIWKHAGEIPSIIPQVDNFLNEQVLPG
ncbi:MAG: tRNA (adenosine(37)-N6)-dimethylallyltransferase MiaA [Candidatus Magnetomorum sp.]|nr:tRNA (adenosine(37)-N6)-dimethylallyltransferase MiaA [Candidatus Magnetomorum sp.]